VPISFLEVLPMRFLQVRSVIRCNGKPFERIFVQHYVGVDIGDTSCCHSLPGGNVDLSSHPCARRRLT
jgi:hypothetical protein